MIKKFLLNIILVTLLVYVDHIVVRADPVEKLSKYSETNPHSIHKIPKKDILIKTRIWRQIDLKERKNKPFFAAGREITRYIIDAIHSGGVPIYRDEKFTQVLSKEAFQDQLKLPIADPQKDEFTDNDNDTWQDKDTLDDVPTEVSNNTFVPNEISLLEIMEDWIFNKVQSEQIYDIQSIKLIIPANKFETGLQREIGVVLYKDLVEFFGDKKVFWINIDNDAENLNIMDAFELRQFSSRIIKIENPDNDTIADQYNKDPKDGLRASQELEEELIEKEHFLFSPQ